MLAAVLKRFGHEALVLSRRSLLILAYVEAFVMLEITACFGSGKVRPPGVHGFCPRPTLCTAFAMGRGVACDFCRVSLVTSVPVSLVTSQSLPLQIAAVSLLADLWLPWRPFLALLSLLLPLPPPPLHPLSWGGVVKNVRAGKTDCLNCMCSRLSRVRNMFQWLSMFGAHAKP